MRFVQGLYNEGLRGIAVSAAFLSSFRPFLETSMRMLLGKSYSLIHGSALGVYGRGHYLVAVPTWCESWCAARLLVASRSLQKLGWTPNGVPLKLGTSS